MHIQMNNEIFNGLKMIKYSVNHPWKFKQEQIAFLAGLLQVVVMILITIINYFVIAVSGTVIDVAKDFTALLIIADFDDIFGENIEDEKSREVCQGQDDKYAGLFVIQSTTSKDAKGMGNMRRNRDKINEFVNHHRRLKSVKTTYRVSDYKIMSKGKHK